jgi:hypothetical protein
MRRVLRHAFTPLSALSLLLCVAACVLWVRSYSVENSVYRKTTRRSTDVGASLGVLYFCDIRILSPGFSYTESEKEPYGIHFYSAPNPIDWPAVEHSDPHKIDYHIGTLGVSYFDGVAYNERTVTFILTTPGWLLTLLLGAVPMAWASHRWRHSRRTRAGRCTNCGYDLRAHAAGGRCPECGAAVVA